MESHHILTLVIAFISVALVSGGGVFWVMRYLENQRNKDAQEKAQDVLSLANKEAEAIRSRTRVEVDNYRREKEIELKEELLRQKDALESEKRKAHDELNAKERSLNARQENLDQQATELRAQEKEINASRAELSNKIDRQDALNAELELKISEQERALYDVLNLSKEEAMKILMDKLDRELIEEQGALILKRENEAQEKCEEKARTLCLQALQRYAAAHTSEATTSTVDIPNDDMKGRVIGREGRNIRTFEKISGVDVIIDDTPGVIIVSAFDMVRRETARLALKRLIADGRIHPSRIEEIYSQAERDVNAFIQRAGMEACQEVDAHGLNDRLVTLLGRLYFRTSYSQNVLRHSVEVAFLSGMIAIEMGLDEKLARRCGLLHDIGKALDHEIEGGHPQIGAEVLKKYNEPTEVVQAALRHHEDTRDASPYTMIVAAADACSAARPGARRETMENYVKRMEDLEKIAMEIPCVNQAFAVQAGREMRVLVDSAVTTDESAAKICRDIAKALSERLQFPGEIKVTVIRETRTTEIAR